MNARVRVVALAALTMLVALIVATTYWQAWAAPSLANKRDNAIQQMAQLSIDRGLILADNGTVLAGNRVVKKGGRQGVFLPQVATETGWDVDTYLSQCCSQKAGLAPDAWKKGDCQVFTFCGQVFGEKE